MLKHGAFWEKWPLEKSLRGSSPRSPLLFQFGMDITERIRETNAKLEKCLALLKANTQLIRELNERLAKRKSDRSV